MRKISTLMSKLFLVMISFMLMNKARSQATTVFADPAVISFEITTMGGIPINANAMATNQVYKLNLYIQNVDLIHAIPDNTALLFIGLGTKLRLDPSFDLPNAALNNYFSWTSSGGSQVQIFGNLINPLPNDFIGTVTFNVRSTASAQINQGSTMSGVFSVSNNNPNYTLSDSNPNNNNTTLTYAFTSANIPLPVTLTKFAAVNKNCGINVSWTSEQEINFSRYEVEVSKDGINYVKVASVVGENKHDYSVSVPLTDAIKSPVLMVRLKTIDLDGSFKYSSVVTVAGTCNNMSSTSIYSYPNPVRRDGGILTIGNRESVFNGSYDLVLTDMGGKVYATKTITLNNVVSFQYETGSVPAMGQYLLRIQKTNGGEMNVIKFEKL
jgi:hypothetical protein